MQSRETDAAMDSAGDDYDRMGEAYLDHSEHSPTNALYDRPAILELAGDVRGKQVLDVGCAAGALSAALVEKGAVLLGVDASQAMISLAHRRPETGQHSTWPTSRRHWTTSLPGRWT